jgi:hypothetical protein
MSINLIIIVVIPSIGYTASVATNPSRGNRHALPIFGLDSRNPQTALTSYTVVSPDKLSPSPPTPSQKWIV